MAPAVIAGARTAPGAISFGPTAPRAMAADPTAFARSFAAVTERLAGVFRVRRARAEKSSAARLPSRILAPETELLMSRAPEMSCSAGWAAAGPPSATNRAADDRTSAGDGRCMTTSEMATVYTASRATVLGLLCGDAPLPMQRALSRSREAVAQVRDQEPPLAHPPTARRCDGVAVLESARSRGGRRQVRDLIGDMSNAVDLCNSLTRRG